MRTWDYWKVILFCFIISIICLCFMSCVTTERQLFLEVQAEIETNKLLIEQGESPIWIQR